MSNPSTPFGFTEDGLSDGISPNFGMYEGFISPSNTHAIYGGDVAAPISGGYYDLATVVFGGEPIGGIFEPSFEWPSISFGGTYRGRAWLGNIADVVAGGVIKCKINMNRLARFHVRSNGAAITQANVGSNANFATGATPGNNLISTQSLAASTIGAGLSLPFTIIKIDPNPPSDPTASYNTVVVGFNNLTAPN